VTGAVTLPAEDAPLTSGVNGAQEVKTSYVGPAADRFDVLRPTPAQDPATTPPAPADPNALTIDAAGGAISASGFEQYRCGSRSAPDERRSVVAEEQRTCARPRSRRRLRPCPRADRPLPRRSCWRR